MNYDLVISGSESAWPILERVLANHNIGDVTERGESYAKVKTKPKTPEQLVKAIKTINGQSERKLFVLRPVTV